MSSPAKPTDNSTSKSSAQSSSEGGNRSDSSPSSEETRSKPKKARWKASGKTTGKKKAAKQKAARKAAKSSGKSRKKKKSEAAESGEQRAESAGKTEFKERKASNNSQVAQQSKIEKPSSREKKQGNEHKRSQSTTRKTGGIRSGGIPKLAEALGDALCGHKDDQLIAESLTHGLHTYPARMHPATARSLLELCYARGSRPRRVFDPFCGSGTSLVEARAMGLEAMGSDLNPLAVAIARTKTWAPSRQRLTQFAKLGKQISEETFAEGKAARRADYKARPYRVPRGVDKAARDAEIGPWFSPHVRRELEFIAEAIDQVERDDREFAEKLKVCLSSILIKCSKRNSDTSATEVKRNVARGAPARWFGQRVELLTKGLVDLHKLDQEAGGLSQSTVFAKDARRLSDEEVAPGSVGAIVSSPPYAGTYDYVDHHRLRLAFLGMPYEQFERHEIGARRHFKGRAQQALDNVYNDFRASMQNAHRLLAKGGWMALMVGDSVAGVEAVWADELVRDVVGDGFRLLAWANQKREKLGGLEKRAFSERAKKEHILLFEKR